jgi:parallel beta-helix repeat protein
MKVINSSLMGFARAMGARCRKHTAIDKLKHRSVQGTVVFLAAFGGLFTQAQAQVLPQAQLITKAAAKPGPSMFLANHTYYQCVVNYYVSPTGSDLNSGAQTKPWLTLQKANDYLAKDGTAAGTCINIAPGKYSAGVHLTAGGNLASSTGYVVWRCQSHIKCAITADGDPWHPSFGINTANGPNYVIIDGFDLAASTPVTYGIGVAINNNATGRTNGLPSAHHIWIINNNIHGFGQAGIDTLEADWLFVLHNHIFNNSSVTCDAQGSGVSIVVPKATPNYTLTYDDQTWAPFHQIIAWNITQNNMLTACGSASNAYDTDGNGIIMDTFNGSGVDNVLYPDQTLVAFNVAFANGGKGIQVFRSANVTVLNNTAYNNNLDPWDSGIPRGEISIITTLFSLFQRRASPMLAAKAPTTTRSLHLVL